MARVKYIDGIENVRRVFRTLPEKSLIEITHALNVAGDTVVKRAKQLVSVSDPKAGNEHLRDSIRKTNIRIIRANRSAVIYVVAGGTGETNIAAFREEFGRKPGGQLKGGGESTHPGYGPNEFFFPAYWSTRTATRGRIARALKAAAKEVASRGR